MIQTLSAGILGLLISSTSLGAPKAQIASAIESKLNDLSSASAWKSFVEAHSKEFPAVVTETPQVFAADEEIQVGDEKVKVGFGYRQVLIKADFDRVKRLLNTPELFQPLYGLDGTSKVDLTGMEVALQKADEESFQARIFKKLPVIPNQDYILQYSNQKSDALWIQRAKLVEDKSDFALRDNLKVLEKTEQGTVFRELSAVYILKWYIKPLGGQVISIMREELRKITASLACTSQSQDAQPIEEIAKSCWQKSK